MSDTSFLRPSALPKLALCGSYRPDPVSGPAAERGTTMDVAFREAIQGNWQKANAMDELELDAVKWAVATAKALAGAHDLEAREEQLKIEAIGMSGTADLLCADASWSADLKSGQVRNYAEQQAAYAVGFMDRYFVDEWTIHLLFCDAQEVVSLYFARDGAEALVRNVIAKAVSGEPPTPNDYCGWCALRFECSARQESLGIIPLEGILMEKQPSELLRNFALRAKVVEDFAERARELLKERVIGGEKIAGCSVVAKRGTRKMPERVVELHLMKLGVGDILNAYGPISETKLREIWSRKLPDTKFPEDQVQEMPGSSYLRVSQPKAAK